MRYTVMLHRQPPGGYIVHAPVAPHLSQQGPNAPGGIAPVKNGYRSMASGNRNYNTRNQHTNPSPATQENPWLATAGIFADDPTLEPRLQAILAERDADLCLN